MTVLILMTCLISDPSQCEERIVPLSDATMNQCMMGAKDIAATWQNANETWRVLEFRCNRDSALRSE